MSSLKRKLRESKKIKCPFAINWIIPKSIIEGMKEHDEYLVTPIYKAPNIPGVGYQIRLHPARNWDGNIKCLTFIFLVDFGGNETEVYGNYSVEIKSNHLFQVHRFNYVKTDTKAYGQIIGVRNKILNPENNFFENDQLILRFCGTLNVFRPDADIPDWIQESEKANHETLGNAFWFNSDPDYTFAVKEKEIRIHKTILSIRSETFRGMFQSPFLETVENRTVIDDFSFDTVEAAIHLCYDWEVEKHFDLSLLTDLIRFFDKYLMHGLKGSMEYRLIKEIDVTNVCLLASTAVGYNAFILEEACIKFLQKCLKENRMVSDIDDLPESIASMGFNLAKFSYKS